MPDKRHIALEGSYNTRDIGGYTIDKDRVTRSHRYIRCDGMHRLTDEDQNKLTDYGLKTIIDLRTTEEVNQEPNVFANSTLVKYIRINIIGDAALTAYDQQVKTGVSYKRIEAAYTSWLENRKPMILKALSILSDSGNGMTLYHCSAGKDRTGIITALLLGIVGVRDDIIIEVYSLTAEFLFQRFLNGDAPVAEKEINSVQEYEAEYCPREGMRGTLQHLNLQYGGIEQYVRSIGLTDDQIDGIRYSFVE